MARGDCWLVVRPTSSLTCAELAHPASTKKIHIKPTKPWMWNREPRSSSTPAHDSLRLPNSPPDYPPAPRRLPHSPWRRGQSLGHGKLRPCDLLTGSNQSKEVLGQPTCSRSASATAWPNSARVHPAASFLPPRTPAAIAFKGGAWGDAAKGSGGD
jgi:hypothetical protein